MCWSWQVSLSFTIAELLVICVLFYRNKFLDRSYALMALVIAWQEFFQFLLWAYGDIDEDTTHDDCSLSNKIFSACIVLFVAGVPFWFHFALYFMTLFPKNEQPWQKRFYLFLLFVDFLFYIGALANYMRGNAPCAYLSDSGHLDWGFTDLSYQSSFRTLETMIYFVLSLLTPFVFRPIWPTLLFTLNGAISFIILYFIDGWGTYGAGSMWCWEAGFNCLFYLITPYIANFIISKYNSENSDNYNRLIRLLFDGTDEIMKKSEKYGSFTIKYGNKIEWRKLLCLCGDSNSDSKEASSESQRDEEFKYDIIKDADDTPAV